MMLDPAFWKQLGLLFFSGAFAGILIWLGWTRRAQFDEAARLPLAPDDPPRSPSNQEHRHG